MPLASRLRGEEFDVFEIVELAFDESFPEGTFSLELPGSSSRESAQPCGTSADVAVCPQEDYLWRTFVGVPTEMGD